MAIRSKVTVDNLLSIFVFFKSVVCCLTILSIATGGNKGFVEGHNKGKVLFQAEFLSFNHLRYVRAYIV